MTKPRWKQRSKAKIGISSGRQLDVQHGTAAQADQILESWKGDLQPLLLKAGFARGGSRLLATGD
jgi:hypothetical protein